MAVIFELPIELEKSLRLELGDLNVAAKEATLVELYRQEKLTQHELAVALGIDRLEAEAVLKKHNVTEDLPTMTEYNAALSRLRTMTNE